MTPRLLLSVALAGALAVPTAAGPAPNVVASIKPLHALVAGVMEGVGTPELLIAGAASPHGYTMKPSDATALENADLVFWIGEDIETFLPEPLESLAGDATAVEMMEIDGLTLLEGREGGLFEAHSHEGEAHDEQEHEHEGEAGAHDEHEHEHGAYNSHIWLDPQNARLMVAAIADALIAADPENQARYNANGRDLAQRLSALEDEIATELEPVAAEPFFVFHDAYPYFENRFGIAATGSFTVTPDVAPGAGRLTEIAHTIEETGAACIFAEPQFSPRVAETIAAETGARIGTLDPLGADLDEGPELYFTLLHDLADNLTACLEQ